MFFDEQFAAPTLLCALPSHYYVVYAHVTMCLLFTLLCGIYSRYYVLCIHITM